MQHGFEAKQVTVTRGPTGPTVQLGGVLDAHRTPKHVVRLYAGGADWHDAPATVTAVALRRRSIQITFGPAPALTFLREPPTDVEARNNALTALYLVFRISDPKHRALEEALRAIYAHTDILAVDTAEGW
jgi:hypothetical protein